MAANDPTNEANKQKAIVDTPEQKVTLKKSVTWGSTTYSAGAVIMPDRAFKKYLVNNNLIKEGERQPGEKQPDVRTRSSKTFGKKS